MSSEKKDLPVIETEPIFAIHIDFSDGSNPMVYYNLSLASVMDVLKEWSKNWILFPDKDCKLDGPIWFWHAHARGRDLMDLIKDLETDEEDDPDSDAVEPLLEDSLNTED